MVIVHDPQLVSILSEALSDVLAGTFERVTGRVMSRLKGDPRQKLLAGALADAVARAFVDARWPSTQGDESWATEVAEIWQMAFEDSGIVGILLDALIGDEEAPAEFEAGVTATLTDHGCDLTALGRAVEFGQFLYLLPEYFWTAMRRIATGQPELESLVTLLTALRGDARAASASREVGPRDYRDDLTAFLAKVIQNARSGQLPRFLNGTGGLALSRQVIVREGVRKSGAPARDEAVAPDEGRAYRLPVDYAGYRPHGPGAPRPWLELVDGLDRVAVLSDPGLGKSWLVRTESVRGAEAALARLADTTAAADVELPVPLRCDQLIRAQSGTLGEAAASHFAGLGWIAARSQSALARQIDAGNGRLLLDAYDELPNVASRARLGDLLTTWASGSPGRRWLLTSRIAGWTGPPADGATEIELQALTPDDVTGFIRAWGLPTTVEERLLALATDPAVAGLARIPLLLAMLCSLATRSPADEELPRTRTALYNRMLRWYLEHPHRGQSAAPARFGTETVLEILATVAYTFAGAEGGWRDLMPKEALVRVVRESGPAFDSLQVQAETFVDEVVAATGLLVPEGDVSEGREPRYMFLHRTFAEYLTARHLVSLPEDQRHDVIAEHLWFDPDWAQVIPMTGGQLPSPARAQRLLRFLLSRPGDVLDQARLTAAGVLSERADRDELLTGDETQEFVRAIRAALESGITRENAVATIAAVGNLTSALTQSLVRVLDTEDEELQIATLQILRGRPIADLAEWALERLEDNPEDDRHVRIRRHAVELLAGFREPAVFRALLNRLAGDYTPVRLAVEVALARYPVSDLLGALRAAPEPAVRASLVQALAITPEFVPIDVFITALDDEDGVRVAAAEALSRRTEPAATRALLDRLNDGDEPFQAFAVKLLADRGCDEPRFVRAYLVELIDKPSDIGLGRPVAPSPMPPPLTAGLVDRLASEDIGIRMRAAEILAAARPADCEPDLLRLLNAEPPEVREAAAVAAAARQEPAILARLADRLSDPQASVRRAALRSLVASSTPHLADHLVALLADPDQQVRRAAAEAAAGQQALGLTKALVTCVLEDDDVRTVYYAILSLNNREGADVDRALRSALNRTDADFTDYLFEPAARQLNSRAPSAVLAALRPYLQGSDGYLQRAAASVLTSCTAPGTVEALIAVVAGGTRKGRSSAWWALARRPVAADLVTIAAHLPETTGEVELSLLTAALELARRRYLQLPRNERAQVRAALAAGISAQRRHDI